LIRWFQGERLAFAITQKNKGEIMQTIRLTINQSLKILNDRNAVLRITRNHKTMYVEKQNVWEGDEIVGSKYVANTWFGNAVENVQIKDCWQD
jgi:hypothetical protein